jgi:hypothetical protein
VSDPITFDRLRALHHLAHQTSSYEAHDHESVDNESTCLVDAIKELRARNAHLEAENEKLQNTLGIVQQSDTELLTRMASSSIDPTLPVPLPTVSVDNGRCHGASDGECIWHHCPQLRDGEPKRSGRHCPYDILGDDR